jgi:site-specific recombinase XerD
LFEEIFEKSCSIARHQQAPLLNERVRFLAHLSGLRCARNKLKTIAAQLLGIISMLDLKESGLVTPDQIRRAAQCWAERERNGRKMESTKLSRHGFVNVANKWMRFLDRLKQPARASQPFDEYLFDFAAWMENERGLSPATIRSQRWQAEHFLSWLVANGQRMNTVSISHIEEFLALKGKTCWSRKSVSTAAQSLRAFFRHAEFRAWCRPGIAKLIEKPRAYQKDGLPNGPTWRDVQRLVNDTEGQKPTDYRARAMVLLLAVYGLRSSEVAGLVLSDFDWRAELLTINRQKGGGSRQYPLVHEVGEAVLDYLRNGRPRCECRNLFVSLYPPYRATSRSVVWAIISRRFQKLGIRCRKQGPHTLRHACATHLLEKGASFKEIGDLLGHRSADSTAIYAKVDLRMLREAGNTDLGGLR